MTHGTCEHCSVTFTPRAGRGAGGGGTGQRFCSVSCRVAASHARSYTSRVCEQCGTSWMSRRPEARFCTARCKGQHYQRERGFVALPASHPVRHEIRRQAAAVRAERKAEREKRERAERLARLAPRECRGCGSWFCPVSQSMMLDCSEACHDRQARRARRAREAGATGTFTWGEFMRIARRFDFCCAYCGIKPDEIYAEHVVPLSRGGSNSPTNLLPSCLLCNSDKCAMSLAEWAASRAARGLAAVTVSWHPDDPRYRHLTSVLAAA